MRRRSLRGLPGSSKSDGSAARVAPPPPAEAIPGVLRRIEIAADATFPAYTDYQALYLDHATGRLIPNTEIVRAGRVEFRVNSLGCKGDDIDRSRPVIAFFGDSATMGVGLDSWPFHVAVPGYEILNAAVEGVEVARMAERFADLATRVPIACAVVCAGWHNLIYNRSDEAYWEEQLARFLGDHVSVYWTLPTCLTQDVRDRGIADLVDTSESANLNDTYFMFWADLDPTVVMGDLVDAIDRYNTFVRDFCARHGAHVLDLHAFLKPASYEEVPRDFFDACHLRPRTYDRVGSFVAEFLAELLPAPEAATTTTPAVAQPTESEDLRKNLYPLW